MELKCSQRCPVLDWNDQACKDQSLDGALPGKGVVLSAVEADPERGDS